LSLKDRYITKDIASSFGANGGSRLYTITNTQKDKTEAVVELRISKRFSIKDLKAAKLLYEEIDNIHITIDDIILSQ